ncbi:MAG: carbonic anhydrase [Catenulispora sp.]|nr:carbonic anhydrase [Catenulispora sp.]
MHSLIDNARRHTERIAANRTELARLAEGQQPDALFISCSDSRIVPAHITGARPGEVFELRAAGNIIPRFRPRAACAVAGTLQFAVQVLRIPDIVLCGHTHCGAVKALAEDRGTPGMTPLHNWLIRAAFRPGPRTKEAMDRPELSTEQRHLIRQLEHLHNYPWIAERVARGTLRLHAWFYAIQTGEVTAYRPALGDFGPL